MQIFANEKCDRNEWVVLIELINSAGIFEKTSIESQYYKIIINLYDRIG